MAENSSTAWARTLEVANVIGAIAILGGVGVTILGWWLSWPGWALGASVMAAVLGVMMVCARFVSVRAEIPIETIGEWRQGYSLSANKTVQHSAESESSQPIAQSSNARFVSLKELEEEYEPLKKLTPNFVDIGSEYVPAYNDEKGVIVRAALRDEESFNVLIRSFGNDHPRNKVKSLKAVSTKLNYICFDRATRNECKTVNIHRGAWLTESETEVDFPAHCPPRRAVIATAEGADNRVYAIRRDSDSSYKGIAPLREELTGSIYTVFVTLLVGSRNSKSYQYILEIIREPIFELRLNDAFYWKSHHLSKFREEGLSFSMRIHDIWMDANEQVPFPEIKPYEFADALKGEPASEMTGYFEILNQRRAIEHEHEEKLIEELTRWESRAADWIGLFIGTEQQEKFLSSKPSLDDGFQRKNKTAFELIGPPMRPENRKQEHKARHWTLSDSVNVRLRKLEELANTLHR